jgi:hypothetical protein
LEWYALIFLRVVVGMLLSGVAVSQTVQPPAPPSVEEPPASAQPQGAEAVPARQPAGTVLFERQTQEPGAPAARAEASGQQALEVTDAERSAARIVAYDLDARLTPASARLEMRARLTVRNGSDAPLQHVALQVSSSLSWESAAVVGGARLPLAQHLLDTDADHTGAARELILTLPAALAPGASVQLDTFYSGAVAMDATRLTRIGATPGKAAATDWDAVAPGATALRGFGNVLWYPVASPALFLGDGAKLFQAIAASRFRDQATTVRLHLAVQYAGEPPVAAYFCGRRQPLAALPDDANAPTAAGAGVAAAEFANEAIGFRLPSLFVLQHAEQLVAPLPGVAVSASSSSGNPPAGEVTPAGPAMLAVETDDDAAVPRMAESALTLAPLLQRWFGERPLSALTVLDHAGEPFEDGPLVVAPVAALGASSASGALVHSLTHAWVQTGQPWMDEGLAQFIALLATEQQQGRDAMVAQLTDLVQPLTLIEPAIAAGQTDAAVGEPLIATPDEVYYRRKAAAVWLMLRGIVGDEALAAALTSWRTQPVSTDGAEAQAVAFERVVEKASGKDLGWFFRDWVLHDRGLPELSIADVAPRALPAGKGHDSGWLVAVTVHNDGAAECEVPIVIRSGSGASNGAGEYSTTRRLRVPAFGNVTDRVVVEAVPTEVVVNDGTTPETTVSIHRRAVVLNPE